MGEQQIQSSSQPALPYHVEVPPDLTGRPGIDADFGRITVILGANGTGKSQLLLQLWSMSIFPPTPSGGERPRVLVEGNRLAEPPQHLKPKSVPAGPPALAPFLDGRKSLIFNLLARPPKNDTEFLEELEAWLDSGQNGPKPTRGERKIDRLVDAFKKVFPSLHLELPQKEGESIKCSRGEQIYDTPTLSDGEKQVLCLLADRIYFDDDFTVFLVDEPELHLHPSLAIRFWEEIEYQKPKAVFVYATHSLSFALRPSVDTRLVLSKPGETALVLDSLDDLPPHDARDFLGAIPGILVAGKALVTEGEPETSVDVEFYRWLLGEPDAVIVPLGGSNSVQKAIKHSGAWLQIAKYARLCGVIDRDYRTDSELKGSDDCVVTDYREPESYLCDPKLVSDLSRLLGTAKQQYSSDTVETLIREHCKLQLIHVAGQRALRVMNTDAFSLPKDFAAHNEEEAIATIRTRTEQYVKECEKRSGEAMVEVFKGELNRCRRALKKEISDILALFSVKALIENEIAKTLGCYDVNAMVRGASKHLKISDYPALQSLRQSLLKCWLRA